MDACRRHDCHFDVFKIIDNKTVSSLRIYIMKQGIKEFIIDFFKTMNNSPEGHSLRKWLAVGCFWIISVVVYMHTTSENLEWVLGILCPTMLAFTGLYTWGNIKERQIKNATEQRPSQEDISARQE